MKSALLAAFNAFRAQVQDNRFEQAKKLVEKQGYKVTKNQPKKDNN